jgi:hypothetical protein
MITHTHKCFNHDVFTLHINFHTGFPFLGRELKRENIRGKKGHCESIYDALVYAIHTVCCYLLSVY